jgi:hypothetical protein
MAVSAAPQVAYREIKKSDMEDPRLAGLNNLLLQLAQAVNSLIGYNGVVVLVAGERLSGDLDLQTHNLNAVGKIVPSTVPAVTGSRGGNAALASLLTALAGLGLITDKTT